MFRYYKDASYDLNSIKQSVKHNTNIIAILNDINHVVNRIEMREKSMAGKIAKISSMLHFKSLSKNPTSKHDKRNDELTIAQIKDNTNIHDTIRN